MVVGSMLNSITACRPQTYIFASCSMRSSTSSSTRSKKPWLKCLTLNTQRGRLGAAEVPSVFSWQDAQSRRLYGDRRSDPAQLHRATMRGNELTTRAKSTHLNASRTTSKFAQVTNAVLTWKVRDYQEGDTIECFAVEEQRASL